MRCEFGFASLRAKELRRGSTIGVAIGAAASEGL